MKYFRDLLLYLLVWFWMRYADNPLTFEKSGEDWKLTIPKSVLIMSLMVVSQFLGK